MYTRNKHSMTTRSKKNIPLSINQKTNKKHIRFSEQLVSTEYQPIYPKQNIFNKKILNIYNHPISKIAQEFKQITNSQGYITRIQYNKLMKTLIHTNGEILNKKTICKYVDMIFIEVENYPGIVETRRIITALLLFCKDNIFDKNRVVFEFYQKNGFISKDDMCDFLTCIFRIIYKVNTPGFIFASAYYQKADSPEHLAIITRNQLFKPIINNKLTLEYINKWNSLIHIYTALDKKGSFFEDDLPPIH
jgi:hypothetical protein